MFPIEFYLYYDQFAPIASQGHTHDITHLI